MVDTPGWFLTHGDGEVHGPFTLAAIVEAARQGNITDSTQVRHETHTQGEWLPAHRIRPVAEVLGQNTATRDAGAAPPPSPAPRPTPQTPPASAPGGQPRQPAPANPAGGNPAAAHPAASAGPAGSGPNPAASATANATNQGSSTQSGPWMGQPGNSAGQAESQTEPTPDDLPGDVSVEVHRSTRLGRGRDAFIVPETLGAAMLAIFDFRFRYYITPWIIKISWCVCVIFATIALTLFAIGLLIRPALRSISSGDSGGREIEINISESQGFPQSSTSTGGWEFDPPSEFLMNSWRVFTFVVVVIGYGFILLYLRMLLETLIVVFHIATDMSAVREMLSER